MKMKIPKGRAGRGVVLASLASLGLLMSAPPAFGFNSILSNFNSTYPGSSSGANAGCQLCHGNSTSTWNEYGWGLRQNGQSFAALESLPSVNINGGTTMLDEINAGTQPGWTTGANNNLYNSSGLTTSAETPPSGIGILDPAAANLPPVADPNGPYTGVVGVNVAFDGTGSSDPDGTIASYDWDFGDGTTGTGAQPQHAYATANTYTVSLTVTDDAGDTDTAATTATIDAVNQAPTADPNGPYSGTVNIALTFDGSGSSDPDGTIVVYDWDFGDGSTGTGVGPTHTYATSGDFTVSLTVTDDAGDSNTAMTTATIGVGNQPPLADANGPYNGTAGVAVAFDGSGSSDPDGTIVAYDWDFGDGNTGTGSAPTHTYAAAGTYNVTLTVTDDAGATDAAMTTATIGAAPQDPVADPSGPYSGTAGFPVSFDGSGSFDPDGGAIVSYNWDFGDGNTDTGVSPTHTYASVGSYTVTLAVVDDEGAVSAPEMATANIDVNQAPTADPNGPYSGVVGVNVMFDGTGSSDPDGNIVSYDWDFGDGVTGTGASPQHAYAAEGVYDVTLTVTDDLGAVSDPATTTADIVVGNLPPVSDPNGPYSGTVGSPVTFDGSASSDPDGSIVAYDWDFGDGNTGTGVSPSHTYAAGGTYTVSLMVTDDAGATDTATTTATIGEGNQPPVADANGPYSAEVGVPITFDGTGSSDPDGSIVSYDWDFGDGTVETDAGPTPSHTYAAEGTYNVTLTVTDDAGAMDSVGTTATVGVADVYLSRLEAPKALKLKKGKVLKTVVTASGDGTQLTQEAKVALVAAAPQGIDVVIKPAKIIKEVKPGRRDTRFRFTAFLSCKGKGKGKGEGSGTVDWTAMMDAPANSDPTNDTQTVTTKVTCDDARGGKDDEDSEDDEDDKNPKDDDYGEQDHTVD
jgi:PKD repeat protein